MNLSDQKNWHPGKLWLQEQAFNSKNNIQNMVRIRMNKELISYKDNYSDSIQSDKM